MWALAFIVLALLAPPAIGEELRPDQRHPGGTRVEASSGVSFVVPLGWIGQLSRDGAPQMFLLRSEVTEGVGLVIVKTGLTPAQLAASLDEDQDLGSGVVLRPTSKPIIDGSRVVARFANALYVGYAVGVVGSDATSAILVFAGPQRNEATYRQLVAGLAKSVAFGSPAAPSTPLPAEDPGARRWAQLLSGQMLHYFSRYNSGGASGGMAAHRVLHLCADGRFAYFGDSMVTMNVPGASASSGGRGGLRGQWTLDAATAGGAVLVLRGDDGRQLRWSVTYDGQKTFVNGQRWLRAASDACR